MKNNAQQIMLNAFENMKNILMKEGDTKSLEYQFNRGVFIKSLHYLEGWSMLSPLNADEFDE